jgi:hypothetical protein
VQDPTVKIPKIDFFPFLLTELEMADLSSFFEKNDLRPLGVKHSVSQLNSQNTSRNKMKANPLRMP